MAYLLDMFSEVEDQLRAKIAAMDLEYTVNVFSGSAPEPKYPWVGFWEIDTDSAGDGNAVRQDSASLLFVFQYEFNRSMASEFYRHSCLDENGLLAAIYETRIAGLLPTIESSSPVNFKGPDTNGYGTVMIRSLEVSRSFGFPNVRNP